MKIAQVTNPMNPHNKWKFCQITGISEFSGYTEVKQYWDFVRLLGGSYKIIKD